ncbi:MAG: DUF2461 domain-containing protein [Rhodospirillales bacterium]|nr:MAG: DUF2461 domain-containing protein [Rhodospirillales bacterium]
MAGMVYFTPALFGFLRELEANNDRDWFAANKARYVADVRDPMLDFIAGFAPHLEQISGRYVADPRPNGGSLFRIHRDIRFSKDKRPYKTNAGAQFRHEAARDAHAPGFYLHLEPGGVFAASGVWHPDGPALARIRDAIARDSAGWRRVTSAKALGPTGELAGESLKRPPRGYDPEHPLIEDIKRKDFFALARFSEDDACGPGFVDDFAATCQTFAPLTRFLTRALDLPW